MITSMTHVFKSDLCLCLGTSLQVMPAINIPIYMKKRAGPKGKVVIVNIQTTPLDQLADLRIFAKADTVMELVMEELGLTIPEFEQ